MLDTAVFPFSCNAVTGIVIVLQLRALTILHGNITGALLSLH